MSIYAKLSRARSAFHALNLKKSGQNKFAGYSYFELGDFLIPGMKCFGDEGLVPVVSFSADKATMTLHDIESDAVIVIESPMADCNLKGCHPIQNMGAVQTYQRRYLWVAALEIVEHDAVDSAPPAEEQKPKPASQEQMAKVAEYIEAGTIKAAHVQGKFGHGVDDLTATEAKMILDALAKKKAA